MKGPENLKGDAPIPIEVYQGERTPQGHESSGLGKSRPSSDNQRRQEKSWGSEMKKQENIMKRVYDRRYLSMAWQQIKKNAGAAGVDKMTVDEFEEREGEYLQLIHNKLKAGIYRFKPARRVLIPKPGSNKKRKLGIPVVMDRIVSQSVNLAIEPIFDSEFTPSNFGFRRGKSQHQAIEHTRQAATGGYNWCASIDLKGFFDEIPHGLILKLIRRKIWDERFVTLIARALKAGVIEEGEFIKTDKGCPQGSPLSPMLSNIVLNELDHELEKRGHRYVRWADDFLILLKSERAAKRVMEGITGYLEDELGLPVNTEKSQVDLLHRVEFLGFQILRGKIRVSNGSRNKFKRQIREMTKRNNPLSMYEIIQDLNKFLRGWIAYFGKQEYRRPFQDLDLVIRNRLRSMQLKKWKKPLKFQRMLRKVAGYKPEDSKKVWVKMNNWQSIFRDEVKHVLNLAWFRNQKLVFLCDFNPQNLELNFNR